MRLLLIRHGESAGNAAGRVQGLADEPLTDVGRIQALAVALRLKAQFQVERIYASPLQRALETAKIIAGELGLSVRLAADLREYDMGAITGLSNEEIAERHPDLVRQWQESPLWASIPGEEGRLAFLQRVMTVMHDITTENGPDATLAIVAHGGTIHAYLAGLLGLDFALRQPWVIDNASLSVIALGEVRPRIALLNDTCHFDHLLEQEGV